MQFRTVSVKRILLFGAAVGFLSGLVTAYALKPQYDSVAVLGFPDGDNQNAFAHVKAVSSQVFKREALVRLIEDLNLYHGEWQSKSKQELVNKMLRATRVETAEKRPFQIHFVYPDRVVAQQVVKALSVEFERLNFPVLDPASRPIDPIFSNKRNISIVGLAFGLAFSGTAALAVHLGRRRKASA